MQRWMRAAAVLATTGALAGCANWMLATDDRKLMCRVAVEEKFDAPEFQRHPLSGPTGAVTGAAVGAAEGAAQGLVAGAMQGLVAGAGIGAIIFAPVGAVMGLMCASAAAAHPTADADFQRIAAAAEAGRLKRSLETQLNAPRAQCAGAGTDPPAKAASPDGIVTIDKLTFGMGCLTGKMGYAVIVKWHTSAAATGRALNEGSTVCTMKSYRDVDDWFAYPDRAKDEIEGVLDRTGKQVAVQLLAETGYGGCALRSRENGEIDGGP